ncbi:MAG: hybrid sensor histidine kinase/response regulator [Cyanobacteria bacterium SBLK]|nr:hybrid sensor histidine kinase/response regulator [Cyanobacteria bacterium SBLK]
MKTPIIFVVDDDPNNFDVIETLLSDRDYLLFYAASGEEALRTIDSVRPDVILLDVMMPGLDGIETCQRFKANLKWHNLPIIMVTALNSKADLARCLEAGADDFIGKPINSVELRSRVQSMLRIKQQYDELQNLLELRKDMVETIVHDLRNPLHGIVLGIHLLNNPKYPQDKHPQTLAGINTAVQNLQMLVDDLLKISLIESGKLALNYTEFDLCELLRSVASGFKAIAAQKNQSIAIQVSSEQSSCVVSLDKTMLHRTLDNLLSNAIKFSPKNSQITASLEVLSPSQLKIRVADFGPGVPVELRQKIFEKYEVGNAIEDISQIGLGLAFCKTIVEAHQGRINIKDNFPKGSIFEIDLPCEASA